ncbi:MAG TPA: hypothetical protein VFN35_01290 [Ktedonobacteraceae bacterium]|nr:hypothetical protein [Ktedonobacteraceae bacterium]
METPFSSFGSTSRRVAPRVITPASMILICYRSTSRIFLPVLSSTAKSRTSLPRGLRVPFWSRKRLDVPHCMGTIAHEGGLFRRSACVTRSLRAALCALNDCPGVPDPFGGRLVYAVGSVQPGWSTIGSGPNQPTPE